VNKGNIVRPVFGSPCDECGDQIPQARIRIPEADQIARVGATYDHRAAHLCVACARTEEARRKRDRITEGPRDTVIIRG
jgi:RNA polymerase-binding transcription factor DksA